jgi:hypothetical protein
MATKQVLVDTRSMSWGSDVRLYRTTGELRAHLPARLSNGPVVLKQHRGMGGDGVWKVEAADASGEVYVQHAKQGSVPEPLLLDEFVQRCEPYFGRTGLMVEQPFQPRLDEGMIRVYLTHDRVVGFAHQYPRGLLPPGAEPPHDAKVFEAASAPAYRNLRARMESEWVPEMQAILHLETHALPVIWDADFLYGAKDVAGDDTYVLCEINASSTFAFPEHAMPGVARAAVDRITRARDRG